MGPGKGARYQNAWHATGYEFQKPPVGSNVQCSLQYILGPEPEPQTP